MTEYFDFDIQESYMTEWREYLDLVDPKYHIVLTHGLYDLQQWYGDKAYKNTDEWFTILLGMILQLEYILLCKREHPKVEINIDDLVAKPKTPDNWSVDNGRTPY